MDSKYYETGYKRVPGLRDAAPNSPVKVFNAAGRLLRIEPDKPRKTKFNHAYATRFAPRIDAGTR
jgi:hypothetical protein